MVIYYLTTTAIYEIYIALRLNSNEAIINETSRRRSRKQFSFKTDVDPMLVVQCNCKSCRRCAGSINIACLYADTEVDFEGETSVYEFAGGSGFINRAHFCSTCNVRVYNKLAPKVLEGMVSIPVGCFNNTNELAPKVEIWSEEKLGFLSKSECFRSL